MNRNYERAMLSSYLERCRPAQSWVTDSSQYPSCPETEPSYSDSLHSDGQFPRNILLAFEWCWLTLGFFTPVGSFENEVVNINALWDVSFSHRILCAFGRNTAADVVRQEAGWPASCCPNAGNR